MGRDMRIGYNSWGFGRHAIRESLSLVKFPPSFQFFCSCLCRKRLLLFVIRYGQGKLNGQCSFQEFSSAVALQFRHGQYNTPRCYHPPQSPSTPSFPPSYSPPHPSPPLLFPHYLLPPLLFPRPPLPLAQEAPPQQHQKPQPTSADSTSPAHVLAAPTPSRSAHPSRRSPASASRPARPDAHTRAAAASQR